MQMSNGGITFYYNKTWELSKDTKKIFLHALYSGVINILLNIISQKLIE